jgi:hypothetical protein
VNDDELLRAVATSMRRETQAIEELEAPQPDDAVLLERAASLARRELGAMRSGVAPGESAPRPRRERRRSARSMYDALRTWPAWAALGAAAAVVLSLTWVSLRPPTSPGGPALPDYELALLAGGIKTERGPADSEDAAIRVRAGSRLDLVARPASRVGGALEARAFLLHDGTAIPWDASIQPTAEGSLRIQGAIGERLPLSMGRWGIAIVVARAGSLPGHLSEVAASEQREAPGRAWTVARIGLQPLPAP